MPSLLLVLQESDSAATMLRWGVRFAHARRTSLSLLCVKRRRLTGRARVIRVSALDGLTSSSSANRAPTPEDEAAAGSAPPTPQEPAVAALLREVALEVLGDTFAGGEESGAVRRLQNVSIAEHSAEDVVEATLAAIREQGADLVVVSRRAEEPSEGLAAQLLRRCPAAVVALYATEDSGLTCDRIVVPAAGGPHALVALKLAEHLSIHSDARIEPVFVAPDAGEESEDVGRARIRSILTLARVRAEHRIEPRVVIADRVLDGIEKAAKGADLLMIGATGHGRLRRMVSKDLAAQLMKHGAAPAIAVVRRARPLGDRFRDWLEAAIARRIPQLERAERIQLFERLEVGSRFDVDFVALLGLATAIAALGLIQDAPAVVIGAMLVAPLMMPMIGAGLAIAQNNLVLTRVAARSILLGFLVALAIGYLAGAALPVHDLTHELKARAHPNPIDFVVALLSGVAAAYATARPGLSGALPGVAIAAALVPPIATAGIALALGETQAARGAASLFGTNLGAIVVGAAICLYAVGVRGTPSGGKSRSWAYSLLIVLTFAGVGFSFPFGSHVLTELVAKAPGDRAPSRDALKIEVAAYLESRDEDLRLVSLTQKYVSDHEVILHVDIEAAEPAKQTLAGALAVLAQRRLGTAVEVRLETHVVRVARVVPPDAGP